MLETLGLGFLTQTAWQVAITIVSAPIIAGLYYLHRRGRRRLDQYLDRRTLVFVSYGGTCRDPMAKVIAEDLLKDREPRIRIRSAGTLKGQAGTCSKAARQIVREEMGTDLLKDHETRSVDVELVTEANLILAMTDAIAAEIRKGFPSAAHKTHSLMDFLGRPGQIEDPYRGPDQMDARTLERYRSCFRQLRAILTENIDAIHSAVIA